MSTEKRSPKPFEILIVAFSICTVLVALNWKKVMLQEIPIEYICELNAVANLPFIKFKHAILTDDTWFMVIQEDQYEHWLGNGLKLPGCDFSKNYLILSKYKLEHLFFNPKWIDQCCGVPRGYTDLDRSGSRAGMVYIYRMPRILLAQAIG